MAGKWRRYSDEKNWQKLTDLRTLGLNFLDIWRFWVGFSQSIFYLRRLKPQTVFVKGGFVGLPVGLAAVFLRLPLVIHESDVSPGLTNRILARYSKCIATGFPAENYPAWPVQKVHFTGNPVRPALLKAAAREGSNHFKPPANLPTVLIMGGSSGAEGINRQVLKLLPRLTAKYHIIHQTGKKDFDAMQRSVAKLKLPHRERYKMYAFFDQYLADAYRAAGVVVSRAGMNTVAEVAAFSKPIILVPTPQLNHQIRNAEVLNKAGVARINQADLQPDLLPEIAKIIESPDEYRAQIQALQQFTHPSAASQLAKLIIQTSATTPN